MATVQVDGRSQRTIDKRLAEISRKLGGGGGLRVGFLSGATYPDGTSVAMVAAIQDGGAPRAGIPPRPFFRNMINAKKGEWPAAVEQNLKATDYDINKTLQRVGEGIAGQLRQCIVDFDSVPLAPRTIARKGHSKQLVDSGHMLNSVEYQVTLRK
jgi:hypothetical protein